MYQQASYSQSPTHSRPVECNSRQAIQARPDIFKQNCLSFQRSSRKYAMHQPQIDLFAMRFNNKLVQYVSPVPDPQAWAIYALGLPWDDLDPYAFPPAAILGKVVKLQDYQCRRIILIAPGWPNIPWFLDLVAMSSQIPLEHAQPAHTIIQTPHRNLSNLNLNTRLLEPQQSRSRTSVGQWQHELRLHREDQPDQSMRQSGPFFTSDA